MIKKSVLAVMGVIASSAAVAGTMGPICTPGNVTVPCETRQWELGIQALYLQSTFTNPVLFPNVIPFALPVLTADNNLVAPPVIGFENALYHKIDNTWNWGFNLEGAYHFNTGNDITVSWLHYRGNAADGWTVPFETAVIRPLYTGTETINFISSNQFDQVNVEMGQYVNTGLFKSLRFYGGLQYAHIENNTDTCMALNLARRIIPNDPPQFTAPPRYINLLGGEYADTSFDGVGALVGLDYAYYLTETFSITANGSGSLLYGNTRYSAGILDASGANTIASFAVSGNTIVPSVEAKLGLNYAWIMNLGEVNIQAGYLALNYFNPLQVQALGFIAGASNSDYGLNGPYVGFNYVGNV